MVPAHHIVELDQVGCPDPAPRYQRFFDPPVGLGSTDVGEAGAAYIATAYESVLRWMKTVPGDEPVAIAFSGGVDSTAVLLMAVRANAAIGGSPDRIRAFTLDLGGGRDAAQAERVVRDLGLEAQWERIVASPERHRPRGGDSPDRGLPSARRRVRGNRRCVCCAAFASDTRV